MSTHEPQTKYYSSLSAFGNLLLFLVLVLGLGLGAFVAWNKFILPRLGQLPAFTVGPVAPLAIPTVPPRISPPPAQPAYNGGNTTIAPQSDPVATPPPIQAPAQEPAPANLEPSAPSNNPGYDASTEPGCDAKCAAESQRLAAELKYQQQLRDLYMPDENTGKNPNLGESHPGDNPGFTSDVETQP